MSRKRIVILGAGYAGLGTAMALERMAHVRRSAHVLLVDRRPYHLLKTELHAVATGLLPPSRVALPLNLLFKRGGVETLCAEVTAVNADRGFIEAGGETIPFDVLAAAPGAVINFYNIPGMEPHAETVTELDPALRVRRRVRELVREARTGRRSRIIVVGAGAEGVEVAAYLMDRFVQEKLPQDKRPGVTLVEGSGLILAGGRYTKSIRRRARRRMEHCGVRVLCGTRVREAEPGRLAVERGEALDYDLLIWAGGLLAEPLAAESLPAPTGAARRIAVRDTLALQDQENIFVLGDAALSTYGAAHRPVPMAAQYAVQQAETVAHNIAALLRGRSRMRAFAPQMRGEFVSIGNREAVGWIGPVEMLGRDAQVMKQAILARYLLGIGVNPAEWFAGQGAFARHRD